MFIKYTISLMDDKWGMIVPKMRVKCVPRYGELIYLNDLQQYFRVLNVIHTITNKHEIFVIVELFDKKN